MISGSRRRSPWLKTNARIPQGAPPLGGDAEGRQRDQGPGADAAALGRMSRQELAETSRFDGSSFS